MDVIEQEQITFDQALNHWYYRSKYCAMLSWIRNIFRDTNEVRVADFGCGAGLFLSLLLQDGIFRKKNLLGIDSAYKSEEVLRSCGVKVVPSLENKNFKFDLFLLMDVLEHVENDHDILFTVLQHCRAGSHLFVTVPAMQWIWSGHDFYLGHKRRYTVNSLKNLFQSQRSLEILGIHYFYASILPFAIPVRLFRRFQKDSLRSDMKPTSKLINIMIEILLKAEMRVMKHNQFAGLSVMALCRVV